MGEVPSECEADKQTHGAFAPMRSLMQLAAEGSVVSRFPNRTKEKRIYNTATLSAPFGTTSPKGGGVFTDAMPPYPPAHHKGA